MDPLHTVTYDAICSCCFLSFRNLENLLARNKVANVYRDFVFCLFFFFVFMLGHKKENTIKIMAAAAASQKVRWVTWWVYKWVHFWIKMLLFLLLWFLFFFSDCQFLWLLSILVVLMPIWQCSTCAYQKTAIKMNNSQKSEIRNRNSPDAQANSKSPTHKIPMRSSWAMSI